MLSVSNPSSVIHHPSPVIRVSDLHTTPHHSLVVPHEEVLAAPPRLRRARYLGTRPRQRLRVPLPAQRLQIKGARTRARVALLLLLLSALIRRLCFWFVPANPHSQGEPEDQGSIQLGGGPSGQGGGRECGQRPRLQEGDGHLRFGVRIRGELPCRANVVG